MTTAAPHRELLLAEQLERLLGDTAPVALEYLREHVQWVELAGGEGRALTFAGRYDAAPSQAPTER